MYVSGHNHADYLYSVNTSDHGIHFNKIWLYKLQSHSVSFRYVGIQYTAKAVFVIGLACKLSHISLTNRVLHQFTCCKLVCI